MATPPQAGPPRRPGDTPQSLRPDSSETPQPPGVTPSPAGAAGAAFQLKPGERPLPDFELLRKLGKGGFGEVWQAAGPGGFDVALKFIHLGDQAGAIEERSLEVMKKIHHANLVVQFGAWQREGYLIIAMELGERTLLDRLKEAAGQGLPGIPRDELLESMREAAKGLDHLNQLGVQHRDVKPANFLLVGGAVKVADYGLAKLLEHTLSTGTGSMTPAYAPPEFFQNQVSRWSDQYSLAVTYCQLRGNQLPFTGNLASIMAGHLTRPPDLAMLPEAEGPAVARALAKKPEERWPSCRTFVEALAASAVGVAQPSPLSTAVPPAAESSITLRVTEAPARPAHRRWWAAGVAGLLALVTLVLIGIVLGLGRTGPGKATAPESVAQTQPPIAPGQPEKQPRPKEPQPQPAPPLPAPLPAVLRLLPLKDVTVTAGQQATLQAQVERQNCAGPVELDVEGLPDKVRVPRLTLAADAVKAGLALTADADAEEAVQAVRVRARLGTLRSEEQVVTVTVKVPPSLRMLPLAAMTLEAGKTTELAVRVERRNCKGPIELRLEDPPTGVTARRGLVPATSDVGHLELTAAAAAAAVNQLVRVRAVAGDAQALGDFRLSVRPSTTATAEVRNSIDMRLVLIPAGSFRMGSPKEEEGRYENEEQHEVEITRPFYLGKYEVTVGQFRAFVQDTGHQTDAEKDEKGGSGYDEDQKAFFYNKKYSWRNPGFAQTDDHPVVNVTWNDAKAFCDWLSKKEGQKYGLPTEAQWEYSCRARTKTRFYSGDNDDSLQRAANIADKSLKARWNYSNLTNKAFQKIFTDWFDHVSWDDQYPFTAPVGQFQPNAFGLHDMHGNAWEWCEDWYDEKYYQNSPAQDPPGPSAGSFRVSRGGSFSRVPRYCRAANRDRYEPAYRDFNLGFRVVRLR